MSNEMKNEITLLVVRSVSRGIGLSAVCAALPAADAAFIKAEFAFWTQVAAEKRQERE